MRSKTLLSPVVAALNSKIKIHNTTPEDAPAWRSCAFVLCGPLEAWSMQEIKHSYVICFFYKALKRSKLRVNYTLCIHSAPLSCSEDTYAFFMRIWDKKMMNIKEQVYIAYLNGANQVLCWDCLNSGNCDGTLFDVKLAMASALTCLASKIIIAHNHPSGLIKPSSQDINITERLSKAAALMEIKLADHIILSRNGYYSFADGRLLKS